MRSDTTADISDSIAPSIATVNAGPSSPCTSPACHRGITRWGKPFGIPPNLDPIVSTGILRRYAATVTPNIATIGPGMRPAIARHTSITATVPAASNVARHDQVGAEAANAFILSQNSPGTFGSFSPKKSL